MTKSGINGVMLGNIPKHFVLQTGALIALYVVLVGIITLLFGVIDLRYPDEAQLLYGSGSGDAIRNSIAMLVVFFPTYVILTRISNQMRRQTTDGDYTTLTKWLIYLSLLVAGGLLLGDLVTLINAWLSGELTIRFILKAFMFFVIIGSAFAYYVLDLRGYFNTRARLAWQLAGVATAVVIISVIAGFTYIESPQTVREMRLDDTQISDLQEIQFHIEEFYTLNDRLPETIDAAYQEVTSGFIPVAPTDRTAYVYSVTGEQEYKLCATFAHPSELTAAARPVVPMKDQNFSWDHPAGEHCFTRVITRISNQE